MHMGARFLHCFLALNFVFAIPRNLRQPTVWRASIFVIGGLLVAGSWVWDLMSGAEPDWIKRGFHLYFWSMFVVYVPDVCVKVRTPEETQSDCPEDEIENTDDKLLFMERFGIVGECALAARQMLFELYVEIPLLIIYGNENAGRHSLSVFCSRNACTHDKSEADKQADKKKKKGPGGNWKSDLLQSLAWQNLLKSALVAIVHVFMLLVRDDIDASAGFSFKESFEFLASRETVILLVVAFIFVTVYRIRCLTRTCGGLIVNTCAPWLRAFMRSSAVPLFMSMVFFVFFLFVFMLGTSGIFNAFASIVVKDKTDTWFVMSMKRMTFYAVTTICIFSMYVVFDLVRDSLNGHLQEETDNVYTVVAGISGGQFKKRCKKKGSEAEDKDRYYIQTQRTNLQWVIFISFLVGGFTSVFLHPSEGSPKADYSRRGPNSISMFNMSLARGNHSHDQIKHQKSHRHSYSGCTARWGGELTALDHAILSRMAYFQPKCAHPCKDTKANEKELEGMKDALAFLFPEQFYGKVSLTEDWEQHSLRKSDIEQGRFYKYYRFDSPKVQP